MDGMNLQSRQTVVINQNISTAATFQRRHFDERCVSYQDK